jgi:RNA polymerase sigma-B factor
MRLPRHVHRGLEDGELQRLQLRGDVDARAELVGRYLPLAHRLARRYRNRSEPLDDLVQVASVGLMRSLQHWDPDRGYALATYAVPTILGELRRHFRDHTWLVRPPRALQDLALAVYGVQARSAEAGPQADTAGEIAGVLKRSEDEVREAMGAIAGRYATSHVMTDVGGEGPVAQRDLGVDMDAGYSRVEDAMLLEDLLGDLDARAREVVRLTYDEDLVQREIAERIGCSQMHVSRILRDALNRMRLRAGLGLAAVDQGRARKLRAA